MSKPSTQMKRSRPWIRWILGFAALYIILGQLATTSESLHQWMHGHVGVESDCSSCGHEQHAHDNTPEDSHDPDHRCIITLLATGLVAWDASDSPLFSQHFAEPENPIKGISWYGSSHHWRISPPRAPPIVVS